jgi:hypothetical protein
LVVHPDKPFPIKYLSEKLKELQFPKGKTYFGNPVDMIQQILLNYPYLRWWMEEGDQPTQLDLSHGKVRSGSREHEPLALFVPKVVDAVREVSGLIFIDSPERAYLAVPGHYWIEVGTISVCGLGPQK